MSAASSLLPLRLRFMPSRSYGPSIEMQTCLLLGLYVASFGLQVGGVVLVVLDIRDDRNAARDLAEKADEAERKGVLRTSGPGFETEISGPGIAPLIQAAAKTDTFATFVQARLVQPQ